MSKRAIAAIVAAVWTFPSSAHAAADPAYYGYVKDGRLLICGANVAADSPQAWDTIVRRCGARAPSTARPALPKGAQGVMLNPGAVSAGNTFDPAIMPMIGWGGPKPKKGQIAPAISQLNATLQAGKQAQAGQ